MTFLSIKLNILFGLLFFFLINQVFSTFIAPLFAYTGFILEFNVLKFIFACIFVVIIFYLLPHRINSLSSFVIAFFVLFALLPALSLYAFSNLSTTYIVPFVISLTLISLVSKTDIFKAIDFKRIKVNSSIMVFFSCLIVGCSIIYFLTTFSAENIILSLSIDYETREALSQTRSGNYLVAILTNWSFKVFNVFLICHFLATKNYKFAILFLCLHFLFFALTLNRSLALEPLIFLFIWFFMRENINLYIFLLFISSVIVFLMILSWIFDNSLLLSLLVRRALYVPALLANDYITFFSSNDFVVWSNSVLELTSEYGFYNSVPIEVGLYNNSGSYANNGIIGSGYAHAGLLGVIIYSIIFGYVIKLIDFNCSSRVPLWFIVIFTFSNIRGVILNADLLMSFLTNGFFVVLILLLLNKGYFNESESSTK